MVEEVDPKDMQNKKKKNMMAQVTTSKKTGELQ